MNPTPTNYSEVCFPSRYSAQWGTCLEFARSVDYWTYKAEFDGCPFIPDFSFMIGRMLYHLELYFYRPTKFKSPGSLPGTLLHGFGPWFRNTPSVLLIENGNALKWNTEMGINKYVLTAVKTHQFSSEEILQKYIPAKDFTENYNIFSM